MTARKDSSTARFTAAEDAIIAAKYPTHGAAGCLGLLKRRSRGAINKRAGRLGLKGPDTHLDEAAVARIQEWIHQEPGTRITITALAAELGVTPSAVSQRAKAMGYQPRPYTRKARRRRKKRRPSTNKNGQGRS